MIGSNVVRPAHQERHPRTGLKCAVHPPSEEPRRHVLTKQLHRLVVISVINNWAIVTREDDKCIAGQVEAIERLQDFINTPIRLESGKSNRIQFRTAPDRSPHFSLDRLCHRAPDAISRRRRLHIRLVEAQRPTSCDQGQ